MKAFGTCLKVLKATNEKSESLRTSLNLLKRIFNILKWLSKSEEISFRAKRREGVEGTFGALPLDSMINHAGSINHKMLPVCFISFSVTDGTFAYLQRVTFLCYAVQFRPLNKKCRAFKSSTPIGLRHIGVRILISERLDVRGIKCKFLKFSAKLVSGCTALVRN